MNDFFIGLFILLNAFILIFMQIMQMKYFLNNNKSVSYKKIKIKKIQFHVLARIISNILLKHSSLSAI
jgi:hypothetical protein